MTEIVRIESYVEDRWVTGTGEEASLRDPATGELLATASTSGLDLGAALRHARQVGGPTLGELGFSGRAALLKGLSGVLREHREELFEVAIANGGNTPSDAAFDIDGASGTLHFYSQLGSGLGGGNILVDGDELPLGRSTPLAGRHFWVPRRGAAVLINAFNFPVWGFAEKMACALLAGMPVVVKPATLTALVAFRVAQRLVESGLLPPGSWTFLAGPAGDLLSHLDPQDVLAFTGSADTAARLRSHPRVLEKGVRVNVEADSLNSAVLGPDVVEGSETWELFVRETAREITQKAGQKCTATRRIFVPRERLDAAQQALGAALEGVEVGDPRSEEVGMGPLAGPGQRDDVLAGVRALAGEARVVAGEIPPGAPGGEGAFLRPVLLRADDPRSVSQVHRREVFGPVATLMPYDGSAEEAGELVALGEGSLVTSLYSDDGTFVRRAVLALAPFNGRLHVGSRDIAAESWGPGTVLPGLVHGGPGRAGAGEELGGVRGVQHYMQRTAVAGSKAHLQALVESAEAVAAE
jgi:3,4-dehydroadipyl-CoA semialdehyde dehydrogenase